MAGIIPADDTTWENNHLIRNGENADSLNLGRAATALRLEVKELWANLWGPGATSADENNLLITGAEITFTDPA